METLFLGSTGPNVKLIQSLLNRIGYTAGPVDGFYGEQTRQAVIAFQRNNGLVPDGIVGTATWNIFNRLLLGYDAYIVQPGDSLYKIARSYYTTVNAIITANPGINASNLGEGQQLIVPYGIDIVFTDIDYTYQIMERNIQGLKARYPFIEVGIAGKSVLGRNLYYIRLGRGAKQVFYNGLYHVIEWITTPLLMKFIENFSKAYSTGGRIRGYSTTEIWNESTIYIMPMVNPDGVNLVLEGISPQNPYYNLIRQWNTTGRPVSRVWKANIRGVDLNVNYPASWDKEKEIEISQGITGPAPANYGGPSPLSEPETQAVVNFTRQHDFRLIIAYHTQGEVIYWQYLDMAPPGAYDIAQLFARASGYVVADVPYESSFAGYKDWFIQEYVRPGYTIEVGTGVSPVPITQFNTIYNQNEEIMLLAPLL